MLGTHPMIDTISEANGMHPIIDLITIMFGIHSGTDLTMKVGVRVELQAEGKEPRQRRANNATGIKLGTLIRVDVVTIAPGRIDERKKDIVAMSTRFSTRFVTTTTIRMPTGIT
jgi:hypothetical protein